MAQVSILGVIFLLGVIAAPITIFSQTIADHSIMVTGKHLRNAALVEVDPA